MSLSETFNPRKTLKLIELDKEFELFKKLFVKNMLPKIILFSGEKGNGKFTLINHLMHYYFDNDNYDINNKVIIKKNKFFTKYFENLFPNIFYLEGSNFKNMKIEEIRSLKQQLNKTSLVNKKRFIILDDVETFNIQSLNALLKTLEEPSKENYFFLINNKTRPLLSTIKSRSIEFKLILDSKKKKFITSSLLEYFNQVEGVDQRLINISPGNFLKFNYICNNYNINLEDNFLTNLNILLNVYKKEKDSFYKYSIFLLTEYLIQKMRFNKEFDNDKIIEKRSFLVKNLNDFFLYNLNQSTLLSSIENNFTNE